MRETYISDRERCRNLRGSFRAIFCPVNDALVIVVIDVTIPNHHLKITSLRPERTTTCSIEIGEMDAELELYKLYCRTICPIYYIDARDSTQYNSLGAAVNMVNCWTDYGYCTSEIN